MALMEVEAACGIEKLLSGECWEEMSDTFKKRVDFVKKSSGQKLAGEPEGRPTAPLPNPLDTAPTF